MGEEKTDFWRFDWLDVKKLIEDADQIFEYPMVDKDPVGTWTFGRVTLAGDAAHPMYPRGSNGAAQSLIDARTLADALSVHTNPTDAAARVVKCFPRSALLPSDREQFLFGDQQSLGLPRGTLLSKSFGTLRYGRLAEILIYDCRGIGSRKTFKR